MTDIDLHSEFLRAELFLTSGQPTEAVAILAPVVAEYPEDVAVLELLGRACFHSAQLARAEKAFGQLVELAPADGWARRALARTLERQHRADEAATHHRMADALGAAS